jgi:uncharacterized protein (UPF0333 family)
MGEKGQVTMEFMLSVLVVLVVFVFCLGIFVERTDLNSFSFQNHSAQNTVLLFSMNINNVSLLDNNSTVCKYIYWDEPNQSTFLNERSIAALFDNAFADSTLINNNVVWNISDINGLICFSKRNNRVFVEYGN